MRWRLTYKANYAEVEGEPRAIEFDRWGQAIASALNLVALGLAASKPRVRAVRP